MLVQIDTYFVLNGLLNGEEGVFASTCGVGEQQPDGWYWLKDGMDDGKGPFKSQNEALRAARAEPSRYTFLYTVRGPGKHWRPYNDEDEGTEDVTVSVTELGTNHYKLELEQYYSSGGVCQLEITQHLNRALDTFAAILLADNRLEEKDCSDNQSRNRG